MYSVYFSFFRSLINEVYLDIERIKGRSDVPLGGKIYLCDTKYKIIYFTLKIKRYGKKFERYTYRAKFVEVFCG